MEPKQKIDALNATISSRIQELEKIADQELPPRPKYSHANQRAISEWYKKVSDIAHLKRQAKTKITFLEQWKVFLEYYEKGIPKWVLYKNPDTAYDYVPNTKQAQLNIEAAEKKERHTWRLLAKPMLDESIEYMESVEGYIAVKRFVTAQWRETASVPPMWEGPHL